MKFSKTMIVQLLLMALLCVVCHYPTYAQEVLSGIGLNIDIATIIGGAAALAVVPLPELEFQQKVLRGVRDQGDQLVTIAQEVKTLADPEKNPAMKKFHEELTSLKRVANDQQANMDAFQRKIAEFPTLLRQEHRSAFGNPADRITADEEMRTRFNMAVRLAVDKSGDMFRICEPQLKALGMSDFKELYRAKALGEDSSPGSTIIDDKLGDEIYHTLSTFGVWSSFAVRRLTTKQTKWPIKTARTITKVILTEAGTLADDANKAGGSVTLEVELCGALLNVSLQLIEDADVDVTADVLDDFAESYAERLDHFALTAAGAANDTDGGMTGVFEGGTIVSAAATEDTVEELDLEDFTAALLAVDPIVLNRMAKFWMHPHCLIRALSIKDADGRPIFQTALEAPSHGAIGNILGYPVVLAFKAPSANVATTKVVTFGDPLGQVMGIRTDFKFEASDHHRWNTYERSFRGTGRAGSKIRRSQAFANIRLTA